MERVLDLTDLSLLRCVRLLSLILQLRTVASYSSQQEMADLAPFLDALRRELERPPALPRRPGRPSALERLRAARRRGEL